jgi:perosamine synthetase
VIYLAKPNLNGNEINYVMDCLNTSWISSIGEYIERFEQSLASFSESKYVVATNNGTTALHLALVALGITQGDEVLVPTLTYIATANAVRYCGATPVLVDVLPDTLEIDLDDAMSKVTAKTKAIIPVHLYGIPSDMDSILTFSQAKSLIVVEDAAEAHGAKFDGKSVGSFGHASIFSFFGNKILTTGEGGAVATNDLGLYQKLKLLRGQGMDPSRRYWFPVIGYNYRMTNIQAAIGLAQIERVGEFLEKRQEIKNYYDVGFQPIQGHLNTPRIPKNREPVPWLYNINLNFGDESVRDEITSNMRKNGVDSRPLFTPMHKLPPYKQYGSWPIADLWSSRGFSIPMHTELTADDIETVIEVVTASINQHV